ncbi:hypothetical protein C0216_28330 [Streptomyces globosus]|uniref:DUF1963 domain-containing protein n=1 Tax=Streptomyces globosus TaxID=68209 RepID=A0A344U7E8_9ACTN|nr:hypothetical protein [Streptomyces globosus]AXE26819.1 hypothetical protein C0216_28330 [Streptomyces globosus]
MSRTTPPRPIDITVVFPQLAPLARRATRLHPRPGSPTPHDSSVGGPLLWPVDEPWPHCDEWHGGPGPVAMLPVAQLYVRDIPVLRPPGHADLLQVLWCPFDHESDNMPLTVVFWRSAAEVSDILDAPPAPYAVDDDGYVPVPCLLTPEQITEFPNPMELSKELQHRLADASTWQESGVDNPYVRAPEELYENELSVAPGWKAGGWSRWGLTDPVPRSCAACGTEMEPLLTIASSEWKSNTRSWIPYEDQAGSTPTPDNCQPWNPTGLDLARGYDQQLHVCPASPDHPHISLVQ